MIIQKYKVLNKIEFYDFTIGLLNIFLVLIYGGIISHRNQNNDLYKYYLPGLIAKIIGALGFSLVYVYYYDFQGDTFAYYRDIQVVTSAFYTEPLNAITVLFQAPDSFNPETYHITRNIGFFHGRDAFYVIKLGTILNLLSFNSYIGTTLLFSFLSFLGLWRLFLLFASYYPLITKKLAISVLFIPSVVFWGSGLLKDSIVIACMGLLLYSFNMFFIRRSLNPLYIFIIGITFFLILQVKAYVLFSLLPATALWVFPTIKKRIRNKAIKTIIAPVIFLITLLSAGSLIGYLGELNDRFSIDKVMETAQSYQNWLYMGEDSDVGGRQSSYTLGEYDLSIIGVIMKVPASINATLFRPYLWEVHNAVILMAAIESFIITIITIVVFFGLGFFKVVRVLSSRPFVLMCFVFSLFFAFAVGFTSYNFGALVRYKIPCLPMFVGMLFMLEYEVKLYSLSHSVKKQFIKFAS